MKTKYNNFLFFAALAVLELLLHVLDIWVLIIWTWAENLKAKKGRMQLFLIPRGKENDFWA